MFSVMCLHQSLALQLPDLSGGIHRINGLIWESSPCAVDAVEDISGIIESRSNNNSVVVIVVITVSNYYLFCTWQSDKPWSYVILTMILQHRLTLHLMSWQKNWKSEKSVASLRSSFFVTSKARIYQLNSEQEASSPIVYCCWVINTTNKWAMQTLL